jgi:hypothetical protein
MYYYIYYRTCVGSLFPGQAKLVAAALGDLIQITDFQTYLEQQVLNVFYYRITSITGVGGDYLSVIGDWFKDNVISSYIPLQVPRLEHVSRELRNLSNGSDLYTDSEVLPGTNSDPASHDMPSYVSLGFILRRESLVTRNGYKRIAGLSDGQINGNDTDISPSLIASIEDALASDITLGVVTIAEPVIVKRPISVPVGEYEYSSIGSAQFRGVGSQNSRKPGRGV